MHDVYDVAALGEALIDFACLDTDEQGYPTLAAQPGGAPANFLAAVARLGGSAAFLGKVGDDVFGRLLKKTLDRAGVETRGMVLDGNAFTSMAFVTLDENGERAFSFARKPGADTRLQTEEVDYDLLDRAKVFHFGTLSLTDQPARYTTQQAVRYAKKKEKLISFDPNIRIDLWADADDAREQMLWGLLQADVAKISGEEAEFLFGREPEDCARQILGLMGVKLVFITCGSRGAYAANANANLWVPALEGLHTVDTTGAGDIFGGSALWKLLQMGKAPEALEEEELREIARFACAAAGLSTEKRGGIGSAPDLAAVLEKLQNN